MIADPNSTSGGPIKKEWPYVLDEIPRTYKPNFRTLPHYPEGRSLPEIFDDFPGIFPGMPSGIPGRRKQTYEECQRNQDPGLMHIMDPCQGLPHGGFKLPNTDPDFERYGPGAMTGTLPSVGQELGKLAGYFLGNYIKDRLG